MDITCVRRRVEWLACHNLKSISKEAVMTPIKVANEEKHEKLSRDTLKV